MTDDALRRIARLEQKIRDMETGELYSGMTTTGIIRGQQFRYEWMLGQPLYDFDTQALPSGWSWAGTPFVTPAVSYIGTSYLRLQHSVSGGRAFLLPPSPAPTQNQKHLFGIVTNWGASAQNTYVGYRLDDGTDNNYLEQVLATDSSQDSYRLLTRTRSGGGTVTVTTVMTIPRIYVHRMELEYAAGWWRLNVFCPSYIGRIPSVLPSFTATRIGIVYTSFETWEWVAMDGIGGSWP